MKGFATNRLPWSSEAERPEAERTLDTFLKEAADAGCDAVECIGEGVAMETVMTCSLSDVRWD